ncbi:MAG: 2-dehydro-3-deoxyphosphogluconate aldolase [Clostridia bacterium]|nr:2-dehydro-3-deoxyphosphogluconate aldolase [Clostridia bacterium]
MNFHELFSETKLVAILRGVPSDQLFELLDCLYESGIRLAEITYDATDDIPDEVTASDIGRAATYMEDRMLIGAGTVIRREQVELTKAMGGKFIISPNMDPEIIRYTKELDMISMPGAMTVSEVCDAVNAGADYVKLFPVSVLGPGFVKAILAPLRNAKLVAVSGVTPNNIDEYLRAGCVGAGIGTGFFTPEQVMARRYDLIAQNVQNFVNAINAAK